MQQAQKKLPYIEGSNRSRTQQSTKFYSSEMEQNRLVQSTSYQLAPLNEVPLASLVLLSLTIANFKDTFICDNFANNVFIHLYSKFYFSIFNRLGFTNEQPINWNNIILPEKTDLYQELARRITNYK